MESYSYTATTSSPIANIISLILCIIAIAGAWKVFVKAGIPGWHSLIPILSTYDLCKIALRDSAGLLHQARKVLWKGNRIRHSAVPLQLHCISDSRLRGCGIPRPAIKQCDICSPLSAGSNHSIG